MSKRKFTIDPDCTHEEYARERPIFGGQKSGDFQCLKCGFTWDPNNPPPGMPDSEPDPNKYYLGGCTSEGEWHKYKCIECGWEGS